EAGIRKVLGISLADLGYTVHTADDAAAALTILDAVRPSITLTDIKMPGMDGIDLLKAIKSRYPDTEVIMLTGHGDMDLAIESLKFQATDFITKPISDDALIIALKRAGDRIDMRRQLRAYTENLEHLVEEKSRQLIEVERLAAVGETVAGLSHTIKNIAGGLDGGMFVLGKGIELEDTAYLQQGWELVRTNVDRIKTLSLDLLNFAKTDRLTYRRVNPEQPARDVFDLMQSRARDHGIDLILEVAAELAPTHMDPAGIHQCLMNLVTNAIDACVDTEPANGVQRITLSVGALKDGGICYRVADTCCGMDEGTKARLFQRFFTTKGERGTGIGLMLTRAIVQRHNGTIDVSSNPGKGSVFTINLTGKPPER
ncbi:MAG: hybrid sensor histidine kinase/response regulator, partial [Desulfobacteraceae bacterium]|nr:hybrid sensor histidine kinase/response regulator [Desulfobacteraceae bacterium]